MRQEHLVGTINHQVFTETAGRYSELGDQGRQGHHIYGARLGALGTEVSNDHSALCLAPLAVGLLADDKLTLKLAERLTFSYTNLCVTEISDDFSCCVSLPGLILSLSAILEKLPIFTPSD